MKIGTIPTYDSNTIWDTLLRHYLRSIRPSQHSIAVGGGPAFEARCACGSRMIMDTEQQCADSQAAHVLGVMQRYAPSQPA